MLKFYENFGLTVTFYANEHGKCQGRECWAALMVSGGSVANIEYKNQPGRPPLCTNELCTFEEVVSVEADEIVHKWVECFVLYKSHPGATHRSATEVTNIAHLNCLGDYRLLIISDDGKQATVDFQSFLTRAVYPGIRVYLEQDKFKSYRLEHGEFVWGDYDLCLRHSTHEVSGVDGEVCIFGSEQMLFESDRFAFRYEA